MVRAQETMERLLSQCQLFSLGFLLNRGSIWKLGGGGVIGEREQG